MFNQWEISADSIASPSVSVCLPPPPSLICTRVCVTLWNLVTCYG